MRKVLLVAGFTFQEAVRRRLIQVLAGVAALLLLLYGFAMRSAWNEALAAMNELQAQAVALTVTQLVLGVLNFLITGAAIFLGAGSISGEVRDGSLHVLLPRSITRTQYYLGKLLALICMTLTFGGLLSGGVGIISALVGPGFPPGYGWALLSLALPPLFLVVLTQSLSTRMGTAAAAIVGIVAWVLAEVGMLLEGISSITLNESLRSGGILISLLIPVDAVYRWFTDRWIAAMGPVGAIQRSLNGMLTGSTPSLWMLLWAAGWFLAVAWLGSRSFRTRDL